MFTYVLVLTYTKTLEYRLLNHTFLKESFYWDTQGCYYKKELAVMYNIPCTYMTNENVENICWFFKDLVTFSSNLKKLAIAFYTTIMTWKVELMILSVILFHSWKNTQHFKSKLQCKKKL